MVKYVGHHLQIIIQIWHKSFLWEDNLIIFIKSKKKEIERCIFNVGGGKNWTTTCSRERSVDIERWYYHNTYKIYDVLNFLILVIYTRKILFFK